MRRLFLQIYLGFIVVVITFTVASGLLFWWSADGEVERPLLRGLAAHVADGLPTGEAELEAALGERADEYGLALAVWDSDGSLVARAGRDAATLRRDPFHRSRRELVIELADGRELGLRVARGLRRGHALVPTVLLAAAMAVGAWPIARRIARRLERLRGAVEELGAGDLTARVQVEGKDEVADLARSFNEAAERIEGLVGAQRRLLASASHELRSPLARLRMAIELMGREPRPERADEAASDIAELDALIEDLLTAARLQSGEAHVAREPVELHALLTEEAQRIGVEPSAAETVLRGDARLLRRLIRNLLENARRHAGGAGIEAALESLPGSLPGGVRLVVADRGPGVAAHERERIFEPFYRPAGHSEGEDGGVGLGLALVREIARHHGGDARCLAREGGGTRFEVDLRDRA
jgi:signal transduction histidine kinase